MIRTGIFVILSLAVAVQSAQAITGRVTVSGVTFSDSGGSSPTTSIDVVQNLDCNGDGSVTTTDIEPFFDTTAQLTVNNDTNRSVTVIRFWYRVRTSSGVFTSRKIGIVGSGLIPPRTAQGVVSIFAHAQNGAKYFLRSAAPISPNLNVRNVTVFLSVDDGLGHLKTVRSTSVADFSNFDNC